MKGITSETSDPTMKLFCSRIPGDKLTFFSTLVTAGQTLAPLPLPRVNTVYKSVKRKRVITRPLLMSLYCEI